MLKWFSFSGISKEVKRIRWPKKEEPVSYTHLDVYKRQNKYYV